MYADIRWGSSVGGVKQQRDCQRQQFSAFSIAIFSEILDRIYRLAIYAGYKAHRHPKFMMNDQWRITIFWALGSEINCGPDWYMHGTIE